MTLLDRPLAGIVHEKCYINIMLSCKCIYNVVLFLLMCIVLIVLASMLTVLHEVSVSIELNRTMSGCGFVWFLAVAIALKGKLRKVKLDDAPAVQDLKMDLFVGRMKGIQGHQNSCYLDATLFAMFGVTNRFDEVIYEVPIDDTAKGVLETMCEEIIFPLRRYVQSVAITVFLQGFSISLTWL